MTSETEIRYLSGLSLRFEKAEGANHLRLEVMDDRCLLVCMIKRAFPLSQSEQFLSIQDAEGKEIGVLKHLSELDPSSRKLVEADLDRRYFTPKISRLVNLKQDGGMWTFNVETSRGPSEFYVRNWRDSSSEIAPGRFLIQSVDGKRYEVPNFNALDQKSQIMLEQLF